MNLKYSRALLSVCSLILPLGVRAGEPLSSQTAPVDSLDRLWGLATLYRDDANPLVEELKLRGRYQGQYHAIDGETGDDDGWENRRSRFGFDARLFDKTVELRLDAQSNDAFDPFYDRLVDAYVKWKPLEWFGLTIGRQKPRIASYDWLQSTNAQPTFERSQIFNQLRVDRTTGVVVEVERAGFVWQAGLYSNDIDREFGHLDGGVSFGTGLGYGFGPQWGLDRADWRLDWLHSDHQSTDGVLNRYDDLVTTTFWIQEARLGVVAEGFYANGGDQRVAGAYLQPTYDLVSKKLQLVTRLSLAQGNSSDAVIAPSRYESLAAQNGLRGDEYRSAYVGLQYFIRGDQLKILGGVEFSQLAGRDHQPDADFTTFLTGVRFSF